MNIHHKIWNIAGPMILANISVPLLGLVDAAILGHLDSARFLGAVSIGTSILTMLYWGFGFLRMGTTGASAQARGTANRELQIQVLIQSTALALLLSLLIMLLAPLILPWAIAVMNTPTESATLAQSYLRIRLFSAPAVLFTYVAIGWLIGQQKARWALAITVTTNAINIALDYLLILQMGLNSDGAAIASVAGEYCGAIIALAGIVPAARQFGRAKLVAMLKQADAYRAILQNNSALFIRTTALLLALAFFTAQGAALGATVLAGNALLINLMFLTANGLDGFAHAAEALVGEAIGQKSRANFQRVCSATMLWSLATGILISSGLLLCRPWLLSLMTDLDDVWATADRYFPWLALLPLASVACYLLDGIFIGAMHTRWMQHTMLGAVLCVYLPTWYLSQTWGNHGLWLAFLLFNLARGVLLGLAFIHLQRKGWWQTT